MILVVLHRRALCQDTNFTVFRYGENHSDCQNISNKCVFQLKCQYFDRNLSEGCSKGSNCRRIGSICSSNGLAPIQFNGSHIGFSASKIEDTQTPLGNTLSHWLSLLQTTGQRSVIWRQSTYCPSPIHVILDEKMYLVTDIQNAFLLELQSNQGRNKLWPRNVHL